MRIRQPLIHKKTWLVFSHCLKTVMPSWASPPWHAWAGTPNSQAMSLGLFFSISSLASPWKDPWTSHLSVSLADNLPVAHFLPIPHHVGGSTMGLLRTGSGARTFFTRPGYFARNRKPSPNWQTLKEMYWLSSWKVQGSDQFKWSLKVPSMFPGLRSLHLQPREAGFSGVVF